MSTDSELVLGAEFPAATREQWLALVDGVLKGAPFDKKLVTRTYDGISIQPLYTDGPAPSAWPGQAPFVRGGTPAGGTVNGWDVRTLHRSPDAKATNEAVLIDLERGATSVWLELGPGALAAPDLATVLDGVYLDLARVVLSPGAQAAAAVEALEQLWRERQVAPSAALASLGFDPAHGVGTLAEALDVAKRMSANYPGVRTFAADASPAHNGGASDVDELGCVLALGVWWLREMVAAGLSVDAAADQVEFRIAATADQFTTIAKLRAARRLWGEIITASGGTRPMLLHAYSSPAMMTQRDPWVNMLRTTVAAFAAGVGGADAITLLPFDHAIGQSDEFSRRVARNTQALLIDESNLHRVIDPAGGSWYVETLTEQMAHAAWDWFRQLEGVGGIGKARDLIVERLGSTRATRNKNLASRKDPITGVTEFPNLGEDRVARPAAPSHGVQRLAAPFEALRDRADAASRRPTLFLANLGPIAVHSARAGFAKNFFEIAGIETLGNDGFADDASLAAAFKACGAKQAVLCSSDKVYEERAEAAAQALKAAGAEFVYLAGNPGERRAALETAGVGDFIFVGSNVLTTLTEALDRELV